MKKEKFNPELLKEELKRFRVLENFSFYHEEKKEELPDLILGNDLEEQDDEEAAGDEISQELGGAPEEPPVGEPQDGPAPDAGAPPPDAPPADAPPMDAATPPPAAAPPAAPAEPAPSALDMPAGDEEEIDVTALVKGSKDAKQSADKASFFSSVLLKKLDDLERRIGDMDKVTQQIDDLEREFKVRNPTPNEKLEMRSLTSGPYTQKLSDYWSDKEGMYDVMDANKKREYILTKQNLEQDYSEPEIKDSFNVPNKNDEYEEEDI